jgi:hypothetical protein
LARRKEPKFRILGHDGFWKESQVQRLRATANTKVDAREIAEVWMRRTLPATGSYAKKDAYGEETAFVEIYNNSRGGFVEELWKGVGGKWLDRGEYVAHLRAQRGEKDPSQRRNAAMSRNEARKAMGRRAYQKRPGRRTNIGPDDPEYHRRNLVLDADTAADVMMWHEGQGTALYSLGSLGATDYVSPAMIDAAASELERIERSVRGKKERKEIGDLIAELDACARYSEEHTTKEAGLGDIDAGYSTWLVEDDQIRVANVRHANPRLRRIAGRLANGGR